MKPNVLYYPLSKSSSADKFVYSATGNTLQIQMKAGKQVITFDMLAEEIKKVSLSQCLLVNSIPKYFAGSNSNT